MVVPAHVGFEHPNVLWLIAVGVLSFVAGLAVNLYRSGTDFLAELSAANE